MDGRERNWVRLKGDRTLAENLKTRSRVFRWVREFFHERGFLEVYPPALVPLPGMEPHLDPIGVNLHLMDGTPRRFYLHTSPEYCMKKLLSAGLERIYALGHVFRSGEISWTHNPEFMLLEWYRAGEDYCRVMEDCEELICHLATLTGNHGSIQHGESPLDLSRPWPRLTVREVMRQYASVDVDQIGSLEDMVRVANGKGYTEVDSSWPWEDIFYRIFLQEVEPQLPKSRPFFLVDYPLEMGSLARRKPDAPRWVERFELYLGGLELANGFSELTDPLEQEARLISERSQRERAGKELYPVDRSFLEALQRGIPEAAGVALGVDRLLMVLTGSSDIKDVIPFPAEDLLRDMESLRFP
ncbi:MAG: EF-P lysine aminoacylase EpmA [Thermodesulfobacteriota bacterium]